ncbi:MAG TPA: serine hydrolase domain-containing protein [Acidobacteriota bacterium]|nr:serine hydrolase domain-containing protein [Acidobacteriota bacterium]
MKIRISLSILLVLSLAALNCTQTNDLTPKLEEYMIHAQKAGFSGSVLVAKDNQILIAKGYGMADKEKEIPFTANTVSTIGSITKQFTGAAILKLQMMGKLSVKDPITKYFSNVPEDKKGITLHHLLTHTAGFPGAIGPDFDPISRDEFIKLAMETPLKREPGTLYEYSNVGYSLLGIIIELISGKSYEQFLNQNLFKPAGLTHTGYLIPDWDKDNLAHGYRGDNDWGTLLDHPWLDDGPGWHLRANGGILSTVKDMYQWHKALEGNAVLGEEEKELYYHPHVQEGEGADSFYGYGWALFTTPRGTQLIAHNGGNPYFSADFLRYVDEDVVIIALANTNSYRAWKVSEALARIVFGYDYTLPQKPESMDLESGTNETSNETWGLPDSITGKRSAALLSALDSQDLEKVQKFIKENLASEFLEEFSLEGHLRQFQKMQEEIGKFELVGAMKTGDYSVRLKLKSKSTGQVFQISLDLQSEPPHKIMGISIDILD